MKSPAGLIVVKKVLMCLIALGTIWYTVAFASQQGVQLQYRTPVATAIDAFAEAAVVAPYRPLSALPRKVDIWCVKGKMQVTAPLPSSSFISLNKTSLADLEDLQSRTVPGIATRIKWKIACGTSGLIGTIYPSDTFTVKLNYPNLDKANIEAFYRFLTERLESTQTSSVHATFTLLVQRYEHKIAPRGPGIVPIPPLPASAEDDEMVVIDNISAN